MKIYTKTGDDGTTGLFAGPRVAKDHPRIKAYGAIDELNAGLSVALASLQLTDAARKEVEDTEGSSDTNSWTGAQVLDLNELIVEIQNDLFAIGAELATPEPEKHQMQLLAAERVGRLEEAIDQVDEVLEPLTSFVLPGGSLGSSALHVARTVCRRAERELVSLSRDLTDRYDLLVAYLNRLSDLLFVLARYVNSLQGIPDRPWKRPSA